MGTKWFLDSPWPQWDNLTGRSGIEITTVYQKVDEGYVAWIEEIPGANTQGATLAETRENLLDAMMMVLEANHEINGTPIPHEIMLKEKLLPSASMVHA